MVPRKTTTRTRLISTAADLFRRQGFAQTGVNQIIKEAEATSGSFYHFFSAKEDLLLAVVDHLAEVFEAEIFDVAWQRTDEPLARVLMVLELYRAQLREDGFTFVSPLAAFSSEVSENHPEVRTRLAEIFADWTDRFEALLNEAGDRLPSPVDRMALASLIVCSMEGAVLGTRLNRSLAPIDASISQIKAYFDLLENRTGAMPAVPAARRPDAATARQGADWRSW